MHRLLAMLRMRFARTENIPPLQIREVADYGSYQTHISEDQQGILELNKQEQHLIPAGRSSFSVAGFCFVCKKRADFHVDYSYASKVDGVLTPNWREQLVCPGCGFNNRMRAIIQVFEQEFRPERSSKIYITEQAAPLYAWFHKNYPATAGSEYLGGSVPYGGLSANGVRNEDLTNLTFKNDTFEFILSFDVFEHVPGYLKALHECHRCLRPGGVLFFSVPFLLNSEGNLVRACLDEKGGVRNILPAEYHYNPVDKQGSLCFYHFGWELLTSLREIGFGDAAALMFQSRELGYLGGEQVVFKATKNP